MEKHAMVRLGQRTSAIAFAAVLLVACDETGALTANGGAASAANTSAPVATEERDVARPDIFEVTDRGLWDGRPSLGGVWVAHPDVQDPERVTIRNTENGREIIGALFRRERENPGPALQISSDAAESLGVLAGAPTELRVVAMRREEVEIAPDPTQNPVVESLAAPVNVAAAPLEPAVEVTPAVTPVARPEPVAVALPPAVEAATAALEDAASAAVAVADATPEPLDATEVAAPAQEGLIDVSGILGTAPPPPAPPLADGPRAEVGVFSVELNAEASAQLIRDNGIGAAVLPESMGGRTVWRVIAGPVLDEAAIAQLKTLGFVDAYIAPREE